jgi:hypothetical protein
LNDFYLWENYLLFVQLTMDKDALKVAYDDALERVTGYYERQHLWVKYISFVRHFISESALSEIVQKVFSEQNFGDTKEDFKDSRLVALLEIPRSRDYEFVNKIFEDFVSPMSDLRKTFYYERVVEIFPDNVTLILR